MHGTQRCYGEIAEHGHDTTCACHCRTEYLHRTFTAHEVYLVFEKCSIIKPTLWLETLIALRRVSVRNCWILLMTIVTHAGYRVRDHNLQSERSQSTEWSENCTKFNAPSLQSFAVESHGFYQNEQILQSKNVKKGFFSSNSVYVHLRRCASFTMKACYTCSQLNLKRLPVKIGQS